MFPTVIIPSMNSILCEKAKSFIPSSWPVIVKDGNPLTHFDELRTLKIDTEWAINLDEDCFIIDPDGILRLIEMMKSDGMHTAGIQDGASYMRGHNPVMFNPFFFLFEVSKIQSAKKFHAEVTVTSPR